MIPNQGLWLLRFRRLICSSLICLTTWVSATPITTGWIPLFKGVEYMTGTNTQSSGDFTSLMVAHLIRVDLSDPDIQLLPTPRITNYVANSRETSGQTVSRFVKTHGLQLGVNANFFSPTDYYMPEGTPMQLSGLAISDGSLVSVANATFSACVLFDVNRTARVIEDNWPAGPTNGVLHALAGDYPLVVNGVNISRRYLNTPGGVHEQHPRTAFGVSQDGKFFYIVCIDGRQDHSVGAFDYETAAWMLLAGAYNAVNMDGGGSTTLVTEDSIGEPHRLNASSAVADSGKERTVGSHLGIFAKPIPGFINDLKVVPSDDGATLSWTTLTDATSSVELGTSNPPDPVTRFTGSSGTTHTVQLTGLKPGAGYYFQAVSVANGNRHETPIKFFRTTRTVISTEVVPLNAEWRYTTANLNDTPWTTAEYVDTGWKGPGAALLWAHSSAAGSTLDPNLLGERIPNNPSTGLPYTTYSFRTHFNATDVSVGATLSVSAYIDDGAVFYLNGREIHRIRMPAAPAEILNGTFATGLPCNSNADCTDDFIVPVDGILRAGDNVLAVEVHNSSARSSDITWGASVTLEVPASRPPAITIRRDNDTITLDWVGTGFLLQQADNPSGPWTSLVGERPTPPLRVMDAATTRYYRLLR
jgi:hypothetical protein